MRLGDGTEVVLRRLGVEDREGLAEGYRLLSPESRYQRFWVRSGEVIGDGMLDRLLQGDPVDHAVWAVLDRQRGFPGMGAASYWRSKTDPDEAELSITVQDRDQRRGVGTLLLAGLWVICREVGIERLVGYTMAENRSAIGWMQATGAEAEWDGYKVIGRWDLGSLEGIPATRVGVDLAEQLAELSEVLRRG